MADEYIDKRNLLQELVFLDIPYDSRERVRRLINTRTSVNLLDRDTGKEPILEEGASLVHCSYADGTSGFENHPYFDWKCPVCGWFVGELYCGHGMWHIQGEKTYCSKCGQKIDWSKPSDDEKTKYEERKAQEREKMMKDIGMRLDNMNERRRRKYGMLEE